MRNVISSFQRSPWSASMNRHIHTYIMFDNYMCNNVCVYICIYISHVDLILGLPGIYLQNWVINHNFRTAYRRIIPISTRPGLLLSLGKQTRNCSVLPCLPQRNGSVPRCCWTRPSHQVCGKLWQQNPISRRGLYIKNQRFWTPEFCSCSLCSLNFIFLLVNIFLFRL